jgi:polar amino acid transport system substrate-binding protein
MKLKIAYIEEPPFGWTEAGGRATGADIELAETVLRAIGVTHIEYELTSFAELLPGVASGRWDMNVPLFITPRRMAKVDFSLPVWAIGDGFLVWAGNPLALDSYRRVAECGDARLGIIVGQVQHEAALAAGVRDAQIVLFDQQAEAIDALLTGRIGYELLDAVPHPLVNKDANSLPKGAFSFRQGNHELLDAFNRQSRLYLGSADHRRRMLRFGLTEREIDPIVPA